MSEISSKLFNFTMHDGSRNFYDLSENTVGWSKLYKYLGKLRGVNKTGFLTDQVTEVWMDFEFRGEKFSVNNQCGDYWFFVENPACSDEILLEIVAHCEKLL